MQTFLDTKGRSWVIEVTAWDVRQARVRLDLDVGKLVEDRCKPLAELLGDPVRLVDLVYLLCERQARERGVTDEEFGRSIDGDVLDAMGAALIEALADFFQKATREILRALSRKTQAVLKLRQEQASSLAAAIDQTSPEAVLAKSSERAGDLAGS